METSKMQREKQATVCFSLGSQPYPLLAKATRSFDILWEWKSPGETYWHRSWVIVTSRPEGCIMVWRAQLIM